MKSSVLLVKICCVITFCTCLFLSCKKHDTDGGTSPGPTGPVNADTLSNRLQFISATKVQGSIPQGPSASSLKISFKDTLYLVDQIKLPVKFQHLDTSQNVAGIFLQVSAVINGSPVNSTYYYDVPEVPETSTSDTVSIIMAGIDPTDIPLPASFNATIIPYNRHHQPIAQAIRPVKIAKHITNPTGSAGTCGIVLPQDEFWEWQMSYKPTTGFFSAPDVIFGADGQNVNGSCCGGFSVYGFCPGSTQPNATLHFRTYYQIASEFLTFFDAGDYVRQTVECGANPLPTQSDFCAGTEGVVSSFRTNVTYQGPYTIDPVTNLPADLQIYHDSLGLHMGITSSTPANSGFGNSGGVIHYLDCTTGVLVLIAVDPEGFGQHLYKVYQRKKFSARPWYPFP